MTDANKSKPNMSVLARSMALLGLGRRSRTPSETSSQRSLNSANEKLDAADAASEHTLNAPHSEQGTSKGSDDGFSTESWTTIEKPSAAEMRLESFSTTGLHQPSKPGMIDISVRHQNYEVYFVVKPSLRVRKLKAAFAHHYGSYSSKVELCPEQLQLNHDGRKLLDHMTIAECGVENGDEISCMIDFNYIPLAG